MLDRPGLDTREINRRALKHWAVLYHHLVDFKGHPLDDVARLNRNYKQREPGSPRPHNAPRLVLLRGPNPYDGGSWLCLGPPAARGDDVIAMIEYLGECDRRTAGNFIKDLTDRLVEIAAA